MNFIFPLLLLLLFLLLPCFRCYHILYRKFQKSKLPLLYRDTSQHCSVYSNLAYSNSLSLPLYPPYFTFLTFFSFSFSFFLPRLPHLPFPLPIYLAVATMGLHFMTWRLFFVLFYFIFFVKRKITRIFVSFVSMRIIDYAKTRLRWMLMGSCIVVGLIYTSRHAF